MVPATTLPARHPRRLFGETWFRVLLALCSPLLVLGLVGWWLLGIVLTRPPPVVAGVAIVVTWALFLCLPGRPMGFIDWPIVFTVGYAVMLLGLPRRRQRVALAAHTGAWAALAAYAVIRGVLLLADYRSGTTRSVLEALIALGVVLPLWLAIATLRLWLPADAETLEAFENKIYKKYLVTDFHAHTVAGLGTVHVPYCGDGTRLPPRNLVLVHGYMAGNAFWAANLQTLAKFFNVYAVEWKGIGRSIRPPFRPKTEREMDDFFVESLEDWRRAMQLDRFILCGHSMGGMYTTYFSEKYAHHVEHLILVSPAGVTASNVTSRELPWIIRVFASLYVTPMSMVRFAGPFGLSLVQWILRKRIEWVPETNIIRTGNMDFTDITTYCYHNWALGPSGDIALYTHLHPGATAQRRPLSEVLTPAKIRVPVTFLYGGGGDWMPAEHGEAVVRRLEKTHYAAFRLVPSAGHQVFMDNPTDFNQMLIDAVHEHERAMATGAIPAYHFHH